MLILFETPAGYSLFKVSDEKKLLKTDPEEIHDKFFSSAAKASSLLQRVSFRPFVDTADAVAAATACIEGTVPEGGGLHRFLTEHSKVLKKSGSSSSSSSLGGLAVQDKAMVNSLKQVMGPTLKCGLVHTPVTQELFRGLREHMETLLGDNNDDGDDNKSSSCGAEQLKAMQLGLSHSLSRYKLKFSADKADTMVIQAVGLLDDLDKEINGYAMRVKEWYGWHFPELQGLLNDNVRYCKIVLECGCRPDFRTKDLSVILENDEVLEQSLKHAAEVSMGTEIAELDILNIRALAEQVLSLTEYRTQLFEYLKNRMQAIAPNLTVLLGELVGARLISHSGSLVNLAKQPASTLQILGAEKALFRALKTKHNTPKYGLIYHSSLIGQAPPKHKGKISRVLAAKASLACRVDALTADHEPDTTMGYEGRAKVEARLRQLQGNDASNGNSNNNQGLLTPAKTLRYSPAQAKAKANSNTYNPASDVLLQRDEPDDMDTDTPHPKKEKKAKKDKSAKKEKKKKRKAEDIAESEPKLIKQDETDDDRNNDNTHDKEAPKSAKKAKKAKKSKK